MENNNKDGCVFYQGLGKLESDPQKYYLYTQLHHYKTNTILPRLLTMGRYVQPSLQR